MLNQKEEQDRRQLFPQESYVGNVWGWRNSFLALAFILFFLGLMIYQEKYMEPNGSEAEIELFPTTPHHEKADSLKNK